MKQLSSFLKSIRHCIPESVSQPETQKQNFSLNWNLLKRLPKALMLTALVLACDTNITNGQVTRETRTVTDFSSIALATSAEVILVQGSPRKVELEGSRDDLNKLITRTEGKTLVIKNEPGSWRMGQVKIYITTPEVEKLTVSGSGDIRCETALQANEFRAEVSGSGSIYANQLSANAVDANVTGSGDIQLAGKKQVSNMDIQITGSGDIRVSEIPAAKVHVTITGSGSATVYAAEELETHITGSGDVRYKGNPTVNANTTGSGKTVSAN